MKILYLIPYNPGKPTFGGALRIYYILDHLCRHHDVTVAGFSSEKEEAELLQQFPQLRDKTFFLPYPYPGHKSRLALVQSLFSTRSHWYKMTQSTEFQQTLDRLLAAQHFDIIQCEFPVMAMYRFNSDAIKIIDCHNVEYNNFKRMANVKNLAKKLYYRYESYKFYKEETAVSACQDALFVTSHRDIDVFNESVPAVRKYLIPNGVDQSFFTPTEDEVNTHSLVFAGMMQYLPNQDGMLYFLDEIFPRILKIMPDCTITIVGKNPPKAIKDRVSENVIVTGYVDDTRPYIHNASIYVVPLRMGGGTRLKVLEALSMKKPVVTTSIGCEGIDVRNGETALIDDDPQNFAESVIELIRNKNLYKKIRQNGFELVKNRYQWSSVGEKIQKAYSELAAEKGLKPDFITNNSCVKHKRKTG